MTVLLVDVGNSRVKWARCERGVLGAQQAADHAAWTANDWRAALFSGAAVERVVAASVAAAPASRRWTKPHALRLGVASSASPRSVKPRAS